jgi:hypothetical protein
VCRTRSNLRASTDTHEKLSTAHAAKQTSQAALPEESDTDSAGGIGKFVRNTFDGS